MKRLVLSGTVLLAGAVLCDETTAQEAQDLTPSEIVAEWLGSSHADATSEAFRHWDEDGEIPGACAVCHSTPGFVAYVNSPRQSAGAIDHSVPTGSLVECESCHDPAAAKLEEVLFPSGTSATLGGGSTVCAVCHQGRAWGGDVDAAAGSLGDDEVSSDLSFINVHYSAAATTLMGAVVNGGYEYTGKTYAGRFEHVPDLNDCTSCHGPHDTAMEIESCTTCHAGIEDFRDIRTTPQDIDDDGDTAEGIGRVMEELKERLASAIELYATEIGQTPILYSSTAYPYFFTDLDGDGSGSEAELVRDNAYKGWTPRLLRAAYNYQFVSKDGGAYAHNPHYAIQLMIDSLEDLAETVETDPAGLTRP